MRAYKNVEVGQVLCYIIAQVQIEIFCTGLRSVAKAEARKRRGDVYNEKKGNLLEQQI